MPLKCEACGKRFMEIDEVYTHPLSFIKPRFMHRKCMGSTARFFASGGPRFPISRDLRMAVPSLIIILIVFALFILYIPPSLTFYLVIILFAVFLVLRIRFMQYYRKAVDSFNR